MSARPKTTNALVVDSYRRTGNVHKSAIELGVSHSTIHRRLQKLGLVEVNRFTQADFDRIDAEYESFAAVGRLSEFASSMGREKANICKIARERGLTNQSRPKPWVLSGIPKWKDKPHPRGAAGMRHSDETKAIISKKSKQNWVTMKVFGIGNMTHANLQKLSDRTSARAASIPSSATYSRTKGGYRDDLGPHNYFRSSWEANYARYLNLLQKMKIIDNWEFEPETFWFLAIKRGVRSYRPDFLVRYRGEAKPVYVEVKGWMDPKSKTKIARFVKYYPQHKLEVIAEKEYRALGARWKSSIPNWEGK